MKLNLEEFEIYEKVGVSEKNKKAYTKAWLISLVTIVPILGILYAFSLSMDELFLILFVVLIVGAALGVIYTKIAKKCNCSNIGNIWVVGWIPVLLLKYFGTITKFAILSTGGPLESLKNIGLFLLNLKDQFIWSIFISNLNEYFNNYYWVVGDGIKFGGKSDILIMWALEIVIIYCGFIYVLRKDVSSPYSEKDGIFFNMKKKYLLPDLEKTLDGRSLKVIKEKDIVEVLRKIQRKDYSFFEEYNIIYERDAMKVAPRIMKEIKEVFKKFGKKVKFSVHFVEIYSLEQREDVYIRLGEIKYSRGALNSIKIKAHKRYFTKYIKTDKTILPVLREWK